VKESVAQSTLWQPRAGPTWQVHMIEERKLEDESRWLNLGWPDDTHYFSMLEPSPLKPSRISRFPEKYKIISFNIHVTSHKLVIGRETYSILEFFGDIGGLTDFFCKVGRYFFQRISTLKMFTMIASGFYSWQSTKEEHEKFS